MKKPNHIAAAFAVLFLANIGFIVLNLPPSYGAVSLVAVDVMAFIAILMSVVAA